jgi:hypothetical protein
MKSDPDESILKPAEELGKYPRLRLVLLRLLCTIDMMISPKLLTLYLRAAARETRAQAALTDRSRWAIEEAVSELRAYRDVVDGLKPQGNLGDMLSLIRTSDTREPQRVAEIFLAAPAQGSSGRPASADIATKAQLSWAIDELHKMERGDNDAAGRVLAIVSPPAS